ncbi:MAG: carboxymuconolactone decarboxylase family protein [Pusillimonas sp.]
MANVPPSAKRERLRTTVPKLVECAETVLYGDIWERKELSKRDRSMITIAALLTSFRPDQLRVHISRGLDNGVTREEIGELITHLAFYSGWASSMSAAQIAYEIYEEQDK